MPFKDPERHLRDILESIDHINDFIRDMTKGQPPLADARGSETRYRTATVRARGLAFFSSLRV